MTILTLQRRITEVGRIRAGEKGDRGQPVKLDRWRMTSPHKGLVVAAAELYGGTPEPWQSPAGPEWEVVTDTDTLNVIVPPADMAFSQFFESWSGGGCTLRCDGIRELLADQPCVCDPENRACKPTTRVSLILPELPGFGVWRVESKGYYSASELAAAVEMIQVVQQRGLVPAELRLVDRVVKRPGEQAKKFKVVTLDARLSAAALMAATSTQMITATATAGAAAAELEEGVEQVAIEAGFTPAGLDPAPAPPIAQQATAKPPKRKSSKQPVPRTGVRPRTAAQAAAGERPQAEAAPEPPAEPEPPPPPDGWVMSDDQRKLLMAQLNDASVDDVMRGQLVGLVTEGRTTSSKDVDRVEFDMLLFIAKSLRDEVIVPGYTEAGDLVLTKDNGTSVDLGAMRRHFQVRAA